MTQEVMHSPVVSMRLYANWVDIGDRTSSSTIQRTLSMNFNRLALAKSLTSDLTLIIAVRLQGHRRTLRSNDINTSSSQLDIPLDISFTIQILIQRRKKYKNKKIPGFKTLAMGQLNLDEILQQGGVKEVIVWDTTFLSKSGPDVKELHAGTLYLSNCNSQVDAGDSENMGKWQKGLASGKGGDASAQLSEEDDESSQEDTDFDDFATADRRRVRSGNRKMVRSGQAQDSRQTRKKINQKNIKQKVVALLRRFRIPDEDENAIAAGSTGSSHVVPPTEEELQEIFEELENISDSGPELEPDKMSIVSNPRPGLRPFFGSKNDILPAIEDQAQSDVDSLPESEEQEMSSEDNFKEGFWIQQMPSGEMPHDLCMQEQGGVTAKERLMKHSSTTNSVCQVTQMCGGEASSKQQTGNNSATLVGGGVRSGGKNGKSFGNVALLDLISQLESQNITCVVPANCWICSTCDVPWLSKLDFDCLTNVRLIDCPTQMDIRAVMQTIVGRIQKFCNSNSASPPATRIGLLGSDRMISHILRAYVNLLQNKACQDWLAYLRFSLVVPPNSATGRLLTQSTDASYSEASWKTMNQIFSLYDQTDVITPSDYQEIDACLSVATGEYIGDSQLRSANLCIGEVMLQLENDAESEEKNSQIFIPFLSELHLGNLDETTPSLYYMNNPLEFDSGGQSTSATPNTLPSSSSANFQSLPTFSGVTTNLSPPLSPHSQKASESKDLYVEYWTCNTSMGHSASGQESNISHKYSTASSSAATNKFSIKANVRNLSVAREPTTNLLCILFVKDKKKDKVLQKLGRKTKQRSSTVFSNIHSRIVSSVSRVVCSGAPNGSSTKNQCLLDVCIDGNRWGRIRYFQISHQWQTNVRLFPLVFPLMPRISTQLSSK